MRWLAHRGGAAHHRTWAQRRRTDAGGDCAWAPIRRLLLSAALPLPETVSETHFLRRPARRAGRLGARPKTVPLLVPANAEIMLEGWVHPGDTAPEGPFGDHTGYYNAVEPFPVMRISAITHRRDPLYLSTIHRSPAG